MRIRVRKNTPPPESPEDQALEAKVDAMMQNRAANLAPSSIAAVANDVTTKVTNAVPINVSVNSASPITTAPEVPGGNRKKLVITERPVAAVKTIVDDSGNVVNVPVTAGTAAAPIAAPVVQADPAPSIVPKILPPKPVAKPVKPVVIPVTEDAFADPATDKAVKEIAASDGDALLAAEDSARPSLRVERKKTSGRRGLPGFLKSKWLLLALPLLVIAAGAVPYSRYYVAGLILKPTLAVTVIDSKTQRPIAGAAVSFKTFSAKTNASGVASLKLKPGPGTLAITKAEYKSYQTTLTIGLLGAQTQSVSLAATGRQTPISVVNKITGKPVPNATVTAAGTSVITDAKGQATIALPTKSNGGAASVTADGYNQTSTNLQVTDSIVAANTIQLVPSGKIYYLSNASSKIDVVSVNLDGSGSKTVLAGTGQEDAPNTSLLASRDWRYVVLKSKRDSGQAALYIIDTTTDKVTEFDNTGVTYNIIGWYGHDFMYDVVHTSQQPYQAGREVIKSYDADSQKLYQLDQNQAEGTASAYAYQQFANFYVLDNQLVYNTQWLTYSTGTTPYDISTKTSSIRGVQPNGNNKKDLQTYAAANIGKVQSALVNPGLIEYGVYASDSSQTTYYQYQNQSVVANPAGFDPTALGKTYPTYLLSPDGTQSFWSDVSGTAASLYLGDKTGQSPRKLTGLSEYKPYGWYNSNGTNYLLASIGNSNLYIFSITGNALEADKAPLKIATYDKPSPSLTSYGFGYGGL